MRMLLSGADKKTCYTAFGADRCCNSNKAVHALMASGSQDDVNLAKTRACGSYDDHIDKFSSNSLNILEHK